MAKSAPFVRGSAVASDMMPSPNAPTGRLAGNEKVAGGRDAAERLAHTWPDTGWVPDVVDEQWAHGAVTRFAELIAEQLPIFRDFQRRADQGAARISPRPFQGILESLQNADDQHAGFLSVVVRGDAEGRELLLIHDGQPALLHHVGAMVLPWLTTKEDDADSSGRWGVGQKTLQMLGGPLEVHCTPFHVRLDGERSAPCEPITDIADVYDRRSRETLVRVPLEEHVVVEDLEAFVRALGARALMFMRHLREFRVRIFDSPEIRFSLWVEAQEWVELEVGDQQVMAERLELRDSRSRHRYVRYMVDRRLDGRERRRGKRTGTTTPLGVAIPLSTPELGTFHDRVPIPVSTGFPAFLNAQFEPDPGRSFILAGLPWNEHRLRDLGDVLGAVAVDLFGRGLRAAWSAVPLSDEAEAHADPWLRGQVASLIASVQGRFAAGVRVSEECGIEALVYEDDALDGLLTPTDQETLVPAGVALGADQRDAHGRWRRVLNTIGAGSRIGVRQALTLFDRDDQDQRGPDWFVGIARASIDAGELHAFLERRSILLASGERIRPPDRREPRSLVKRASPRSLGVALGVSLPLHPEYLGNPEVVAALEQVAMLLDACDSDITLLKLLARQGSHGEGQIRVADTELLRLRNALERVGEDDQKRLATGAGHNIQLRGHWFDENRERVDGWMSPQDAYLPGTIDKDRLRLEKAAADTPRIRWLHEDYAKVLKRTEGRGALGAQAFLVRLGATAFPRLVPPPNETQVWARDTRIASDVRYVTRPARQRREIESLKRSWSRYLLEDRWSPDLEAVIEDIADDGDRSRRRSRAIALLGTLARGWRHYAPHTQVSAVVGENGYWVDPHDVTATWLARAADAEWVPNGNQGFSVAPDLCLRTPESRAIYGTDRGRYLGKVDDAIIRSPVLEALGVRMGPGVQELVETLRSLAEGPVTRAVAAEVGTIYRLLGEACPVDQGRKPIGDMTRKRVRDAFMTERLILVDGDWFTRDEVLRGDAIFGRRRPFVESGATLDRLWKVLDIREPEARDCLEVLREIADESKFAAADRTIVMETFRALATKLDGMSPQRRGQLKRIALWTQRGWVTKRPMCACEDAGLADAAATKVPVWEHGYVSFQGLEDLLDALAVQRIERERLEPVELDPAGAMRGEDVRPTFARAAAHLRDELARGDQELHDACAVSWRKLISAPVIIQPGLEVVIDLEEIGSLRLPADAHIVRDPPAIVVREVDCLGDADVGGRAVASLFTGDRQKVAWAWTSMWQRALAGAEPAEIILSTDAKSEQRSAQRLLRLQGQATTRSTRGGRTRGDHKPRSERPQSTVVRLKDLAQYDPDSGGIVNRGQSLGGVAFPSSKRSPAGKTKPARQHSRSAGGGATKRTVLPPMTEREQLALDVVQRALRLDRHEIADLRHRRGIGADAMDDLRQLFEIKMSSSAELPHEVTLTQAEVEAAENDPDFFLAVVTGLAEESGDLRVRFIFSPLERLTLRVKGDATLTGVRDVEALEYHFRQSSEDLLP